MYFVRYFGNVEVLMLKCLCLYITLILASTGMHIILIFAVYRRAYAYLLCMRCQWCWRAYVYKITLILALTGIRACAVF